MTTADADHAIAQVLDAHEAAYHPGIACPETQEGRCAIARPVESPEARMAAAPKPGPTFATYLDRHDRNQLDARAACAEAERDEALDTRDVLRQQLDTARAELGSAQELLAVVDDLTEQLDRARARYATRPEVTPVEPEERRLQHVSVLANCIACGARCPNGKCPNDTPVPPSSVPPRRAQDEQKPSVHDVIAAAARAVDAGTERGTRPLAEGISAALDGIGVYAHPATVNELILQVDGWDELGAAELAHHVLVGLDERAADAEPTP